MEKVELARMKSVNPEDLGTQYNHLKIELTGSTFYVTEAYLMHFPDSF
jgi:hypothetical protein